jgi:hypothetical protein
LSIISIDDAHGFIEYYLLVNKSFVDGAFCAISCPSKSSYSSIFIKEDTIFDGNVSFLFFNVVTA